jgi:hypothetical protein
MKLIINKRIKMSTLNLYCPERVTVDELARIPVPSGTNTWSPIPHIALLDRVMTTLPRFGLTVSEECHGIDKKGDRYFGLLKVRNGINPTGYHRIVGLRNSSDKAFSASLVCGNQVIVCSNLSFSGTIKFGRKHTRFIMRDLGVLISIAIEKLVTTWKHNDERINCYKNSRLSNLKAHDLTVKVLDAGVIPSSKVQSVLQEWRKPSHREFEGRNIWSYQNSITETLKSYSLEQISRRTEKMHRVIDSYIGLN